MTAQGRTPFQEMVAVALFLPGDGVDDAERQFLGERLGTGKAARLADREIRAAISASTAAVKPRMCTRWVRGTAAQGINTRGSLEKTGGVVSSRRLPVGFSPGRGPGINDAPDEHGQQGQQHAQARQGVGQKPGHEVLDRD